MADEYALDKEAGDVPMTPVLSATNITSAADVPDGYEIQFTDTGMPFFEKKDGEGDDDAAMEHVRESLPYTLSYDEIERRFGIGTRVYWHFLTFIIVSNAILAVVMGISYLQYLSNDRRESIRITHCFEVAADYYLRPQFNETTQNTTLELLLDPTVVSQTVSRVNGTDTSFSIAELFISSYTFVNNRTLWIVCSSIAVVLTHLFPIAFYQYIKRVVLGNRQNEYDNPFAFSGLENEQIQNNDRITAVERTVRIFGVVAVYVSLLIISFVIILVLENFNRNNRHDLVIQGLSVIDLAVTLVVTAINMFFTQIARFLTVFEKQLTWAEHRRSHTLKLYTFKILNVVAMYSAVGVVSLNSACPYYDSGRKFLTLIITDLVVQNGIELLMPQIKQRVLPRLSVRFKGDSSDEELKPEFDLAEEYLELFYRQFVIYVGMSLFPLLPLFGFIVNVIEYPIDKVRLTKICKRPKRVDVSLKRLLAILLMCNAVIALLFPPLGTIWTLRGQVGVYEAHPDICPVFAGDGGGKPLLDPSNSTAVQPMHNPICQSVNPEFNDPDRSCSFLEWYRPVEQLCPVFVRTLYVGDRQPDFSVFGERGNASLVDTLPQCINTTARCIVGNENINDRPDGFDLIGMWRNFTLGVNASATMPAMAATSATQTSGAAASTTSVAATTAAPSTSTAQQTTSTA